jgi:hypothetical protein
MVLIAATTTVTDCTCYFALALQQDAASENHDLANIGANVETEPSISPSSTG